MGCDGGTIPKRDELVKTKKKKEQKDKGSELAFRWQHCAVSQQPLQQPVVGCELGRMYNKESIIETLLEKSSAPATPASTTSQAAVASHIKSLRDVKTLSFTENPAWLEASTIEKGDGYIDMLKSRWICPVGGQEMNGRFRFVFIWTCGCVFSERALKEMSKKDGSTPECPKCQKAFEMSDVIQLNPAEGPETEILHEKMETRRAAVKAAKESKKGKKRHAEAAASTSSTSSSAESETKNDLTGSSSSSADASTSATSSKTKLDKSTNGIKNGPSKSVEPRAAVAGSSKKTDSLGPKDPKMTKLIGSYSVAKDPNASDTYKSLFTSSEKARDQQKAHWVTYNPFYN